MTTIDEKVLIAQLQDETTRTAAFTTLVDAYKEPLYWQIRRMVLNHDDADDVLQNTFIKVWTGLSSFRGESKLSTWLYRIATNETLNFLDRQKRMTVSIDDENHVAATLQSDAYFDGDETQAQLQEAIGKLPAKQPKEIACYDRSACGISNPHLAGKKNGHAFLLCFFCPFPPDKKYLFKFF